MFFHLFGGDGEKIKETIFGSQKKATFILVIEQIFFSSSSNILLHNKWRHTQHFKSCFNDFVKLTLKGTI
jgi:hypothetical protein